MLSNQEGEDHLTEISKCSLPAAAIGGSQGNSYPTLALFFPSIFPVWPTDPTQE